MSDSTSIVAPPHRIEARSLLRPLAACAGAVAAFVAIVRLAVCGALPTFATAFLAPVAAIALVACVFRLGVALGPLATDEEGAARPIHRRHGFWVVTVGIVIGLPMLGAFSLVDPWETHYAEVAREMIERHDPISPWWANEGWFMSKPVLVFWLEAASMVVFGVRTGPDQVLAGIAGSAAQPEWAVRMPALLLAIGGAYILHHGISRTCGRRAGLLAGVMLLSMPGYALLSHQAITDMPLVASIAAALGFLLRALDLGDEAHVARWCVHLGARSMTLHAGHAVAACLLALTVPQLAMIVSTHVFADASGLHLAADRLVAGSPHACTLPGQPACAAVKIAHPRLVPIAQALFWAPLVGWLALKLATETRAARLFATAAWTAAALGAMAKGPAALAVPAAAALVAVVARRSWRPLKRLDIATGLAVFAVIVLPWYVAVFARHGRGFLDELVLRHMLGRTLDHLHDTNDGDDVGLVYFVKQLSYATFPWCGLAAAALMAAPATDDGSRRSRARALLFGAAIAAFALVSAMRTKFHHYGLIALPGIAAVSALWLDERLREASAPRRRSIASSVAFVAAGVVVVLVAMALDGAGTKRLVELMTYRYNRHWIATATYGSFFVAVGLAAAVASLALARPRWRARGAAVSCALAIATAAIVLDSYLVRAAPHGGQRAIATAYYRDRAGRAPLPTGSLVAYQLNWKGENFYTGNDVAIFIASGAPMKTYLEAKKKRGEVTVWFITERQRIAHLQHELGAVRSFTELVDASTCSEFGLVRAEL